MPNHLAIAVVHGMGSADQHYSVELKHRVTETYVRGDKGRSDEDLIWQEIYWGDLVQAQHARTLKAVNYKNDLAYPGLRELFVDYLGTSLAYRPQSGYPMYPLLHARIKEQLAKMASHRRVDSSCTPLIVLAHSFGSVILSNYIYDLQIEQARIGGLIPGLTPFEQFQTFAGFITFGSPLAIYADQPGDFNRAIRVHGPALPDSQKALSKWLNFYDKDDIIAYPLKGINPAYEQAVSEDIEINVGSPATSWNPGCHNGYWEDPDFFRPVAAYLGDLRNAAKK